MLFNSIDFAIFLPVVFLLYWSNFSKRDVRVQNTIILIASYIFYGWWDWRFLTLIAFSSFVDYVVGLTLLNVENKKYRLYLLSFSILVNIGLLGFFKYYNFFLTNFVESFSFFCYPISAQGLNVILPVGISFYTFQTLSYTIDVYKYKIKPIKNVIAFFSFVSFFPQLVAGPIERAVNLLPQFYIKRKFNYSQSVDGLRQILWGLFKKMVIADNCAKYVNDIFTNYSDYSGSTLLLGAFLFAFQIYGDFSGYTDIAIGVSRLFGINLSKNFSFPYFSRDIAEFWRRWHISLSTWFRDYVYIPLGGSRCGIIVNIRNVFIVFILSGFWHGANWTFVFWGGLNALYFIPLLVMNNNRNNRNTISTNYLFPSFKEMLQIMVTFFLTLIAWVFFRAESLSVAFKYCTGIFSISLISIPDILPLNMLGMIVFLVLVEWIQRDKEHGLDFKISKLSKYCRWGIYYSIILAILFYSGNQQQFIYFQF
jgi:alginate O-acetyltransferase complex protein AlgI